METKLPKDNSPAHHGDKAALKRQLLTDGSLRIANTVGADDMAAINAAVAKLMLAFPNGFYNEGVYSNKRPTPRERAPRPTDTAPTIIFPNVGFMDPQLLRPLGNPLIHELVSAVVGDDYYLSNTWLQIVPPNTGRLAYHKDPRGSITFCLVLDDIGSEMGSTCYVPGSHVNTPPPRYCMKDITKKHPRERDHCGNIGDIFLFSPESWHGRSSNRSQVATKRLFYNFYSKSTKATTSWAGSVTEAEVDAALKVLPSQYHDILKMDAKVTAQLQSQGVDPNYLADAKSSHAQLVADFKYSRAAYNTSLTHPQRSTTLLPFATRLTEDRPFDKLAYLSNLGFDPMARIAARAVFGRQIDLLRRFTQKAKPVS